MGKVRELPVKKGEVACQDGVVVTLDYCRFCAHSKAMRVKGEWITSPARAYCLRSRVVQQIDLSKVEAVQCDDDGSEGFRSIMNIIS
ncbi:MAG: hypothetical protein LUP93_00625 [Methanomicrobiales archaeon]|jgi:hypothetical protein|nr:hypothetical protein [Methanomicrobia archaeon]MDD1638985.1 hypothetical protein [Methanomicrobiales archaeon]MDD1644813.1 hypothetical protein [Methanomicrobiales archaeon]